MKKKEDMTKYELETKIACLRNDKIYVQDNFELYEQILKELDEYVKVFDKKYGKENYMVDRMRDLLEKHIHGHKTIELKIKNCDKLITISKKENWCEIEEDCLVFKVTQPYMNLDKRYVIPIENIEYYSFINNLGED